MTYDPKITQNLPAPAIIVDQIRTNFSQYANVFDNNHIALNANNQGEHTNVIMQQQANDPEIDGDYADIFAKVVSAAFGDSLQIFAKIPQFLPNNLPNISEQLTFNTVNTVGPQYQSFIAGGYIVYFGSTTNIATTITLSPAPTRIVCVIANSNSLNILTNNPNDVGVVVLNNFQFNITSSAPNPYIFTWVAIAKQ